ncbi:MAG: sulfatase [Armatimonadetes bacterium]|nr:sulfatase [Armatimonadota bacterium]
MNVICILLDSLNRHFLPAYGNEWVQTPNLDRLAERSVTFTNNYIGSMPCMPTRRDLWAGTLEFPWRPWGSLEPYDHPLPRVCKQAGAMTMLVSDHYHLWEAGGENYHADFEGWEFIRGHENDPWATEPAPRPEPVKDILSPRYQRNMARMVREEDYLSPRTLKATADWLEANHHAHDRFFLMVDEFDPHEPFHVPPPYDTMYDPDWDGPFFVWEAYGRGEYTEAELRHIRAQYAGKVTMTDRWLGRVLDRMDDFGLWDNTLLILMTDHGHFLGEHGWFGKPTCPQFEAIAHRPLLIHAPGDVGSGMRCDALTTTVDFYPTILEGFELEPPGLCHGRSMLPLIDRRAERIRDHALYGWFGSHMQVTDGRRTYLRSAQTPDNGPLYLYTNRWSTAPWWRIPLPDSRLEIGDFIPHANGMPVGRMPVAPDDMRRLHCAPEAVTGDNYLFDIEQDPNETTNLAGTVLEQEYEALMASALREIGAPDEQFVRMGLDG